MNVLLSCVSLFAMDAEDDFLHGFLGQRNSGRRVQNSSELSNQSNNQDVVGEKTFIASGEYSPKTRELQLNIQHAQKQADDEKLDQILNEACDYVCKPIYKIVVFVKDGQVLEATEKRLESCLVGYEKLPGVMRQLTDVDNRRVLKPRIFLIPQLCRSCLKIHVVRPMESLCGYELILNKPQSLYDIEKKFEVCVDEIDSIDEA